MRECVNVPVKLLRKLRLSKHAETRGLRCRSPSTTTYTSDTRGPPRTHTHIHAHAAWCSSNLSQNQRLFLFLSVHTHSHTPNLTLPPLSLSLSTPLYGSKLLDRLLKGQRMTLCSAERSFTLTHTHTFTHAALPASFSHSVPVLCF